MKIINSIKGCRFRHVDWCQGCIGVLWPRTTNRWYVEPLQGRHRATCTEVPHNHHNESSTRILKNLRTSSTRSCSTSGQSKTVLRSSSGSDLRRLNLFRSVYNIDFLIQRKFLRGLKKKFRNWSRFAHLTKFKIC